jgi:hypothetical protein
MDMTTHPPKPVMPFSGFLIADRGILDEVEMAFAEKLGPSIIETEPYKWTFSSYYSEEMGAPLWRKFIFFEQLIDPVLLKEIKIWSNELEKKFGELSGGVLRRKINIDPGYLDRSKVILASTKDPGHRIYLGEGIYADVTLFYLRGAYQPLEYTYADMKSDTAIEMFNGARELYFKTLRGTR